MKTELRIEGMTCRDCATTIEQELAALEGVERAAVQYPAGRALVEADERVSAEALQAAVARAGYRAEPLLPQPRRRQPAAEDRNADESADYDLVIVGSGGAGMAAAIRASELGATAAIVEGADVIGGTCVNIGCIPSKNLIEAAHHYHAARRGFPGIAPCEPELAWDEVLRQKRAIVEDLREQKYANVLSSYEGITLLRGRAELMPHEGDGPVTVRVGDRHVRARKVVIATGTRPGLPPIPGLADVQALDSTTAMELERLPATMIIIGGGAIGLELGQAFQRFGVQVIVVEALERILPGEDPDISDALASALEAEGMELHTGVLVERVERTATGVRLSVREGSLTGSLEAEQLLVATGRVPNTERLGLDMAGVRLDRRGFVEVDEFMQSSNPRIFAAGDVTGGPGFVYVAALTGGIAAQAALADSSGEDAIPAELATVPRVTFTDPQVAAVGMTESEARAAGITPQVTSLPVEYLSRAVVSHRLRGTIKLLSEPGTDRLLGAHIVAPNAGDIISEAVLAIRFGLTSRDIVSTMHPYLTWGEAMKLAAQTFTKDVAKLSCCA